MLVQIMMETVKEMMQEYSAYRQAPLASLLRSTSKYLSFGSPNVIQDTKEQVTKTILDKVEELLKATTNIDLTPKKAIAEEAKTKDKEVAKPELPLILNLNHELTQLAEFKALIEQQLQVLKTTIAQQQSTSGSLESRLEYIKSMLDTISRNFTASYPIDVNGAIGPNYYYNEIPNNPFLSILHLTFSKKLQLERQRFASLISSDNLQQLDFYIFQDLLQSCRENLKQHGRSFLHAKTYIEAARWRCHEHNLGAVGGIGEFLQSLATYITHHQYYAAERKQAQEQQQNTELGVQKLIFNIGLQATSNQLAQLEPKTVQPFAGASASFINGRTLAPYAGVAAIAAATPAPAGQTESTEAPKAKKSK